MAEAVIVSTARTPIGRAKKGSLADVRPEDMAAFAVRTALERVPELDPGDVVDVMVGCGMPEERQGMNLGRRCGFHSLQIASLFFGAPLFLGFRKIGASCIIGQPGDMNFGSFRLVHGRMFRLFPGLRRVIEIVRGRLRFGQGAACLDEHRVVGGIDLPDAIQPAQGQYDL